MLVVRPVCWWCALCVGGAPCVLVVRPVCWWCLLSHCSTDHVCVGGGVIVSREELSECAVACTQHVCGVYL